MFLIISLLNSYLCNFGNFWQLLLFLEKACYNGKFMQDYEGMASLKKPLWYCN